MALSIGFWGMIPTRSKIGVVLCLSVWLMIPEDVRCQSKPDKPLGKRTDASGRKYVNKIPYDVFFDDPLQLMANSTAAPSTPSTAASPPSQVTTTETRPMAKEETTSSDGSSWSSLISMADLQGEIKLIRSNLTRSLSNQGQYRQNMKSIALDGAELAALAVIVQEHGESLTWKEKSYLVREFSTQVSHAATGLSKEDFEKSKSAFQRLSTALDGSVPADAGDVPVTRPFHDVASRKGLMKRIEKARDWMKQDVTSEAKFKSMTDQIRHESAILSVLGTVITKPGYEYTDNDDYQNFARLLLEGAREASESSADGGYGKFKQAIDKINKSCTDCHGAYGNG